jgi:two-component system chemotaxis response regulator CheB
MHLLLEGEQVRLTRGPPENGFRPAIDPLFRSAARAYGPRVVGVILSGALDDGTNGLMQIKRAGGLALVQHAEEALFPSMPLSAMQRVEVDHILRLDDLSRKIVEVAGRGTGRPRPAAGGRAPAEPEQQEHALREGSLTGPPTGFTCPQCGGALWETSDGRVLGYRCHVGHRYGEESLVAHQAGVVEDALWTALRTLEEAAALRQRMANHAIETGLEGLARAYLDGARSAEQKADQIRDVLMTTDVSEAGLALEASTKRRTKRPA